MYYSIEPTAEYHQMQLATGWWTGLMDKIEFSEDGVYELIITQEVIDKINAEAGVKNAYLHFTIFSAVCCICHKS